MDDNEKLLIEVVERTKAHQITIEKLEKKLDEIQDLTISVNKLAMNMERMLDEQQRQRTDIDQMKGAPMERWDMIKRVIITAALSVVTSSIVVCIINLLIETTKH